MLFAAGSSSPERRHRRRTPTSWAVLTAPRRSFIRSTSLLAPWTRLAISCAIRPCNNSRRASLCLWSSSAAIWSRWSDTARAEAASGALPDGPVTFTTSGRAGSGCSGSVSHPAPSESRRRLNDCLTLSAVTLAGPDGPPVPSASWTLPPGLSWPVPAPEPSSSRTSPSALSPRSGASPPALSSRRSTASSTSRRPFGPVASVTMGVAGASLSGVRASRRPGTASASMSIDRAASHASPARARSSRATLAVARVSARMFTAPTCCSRTSGRRSST